MALFSALEQTLRSHVILRGDVETRPGEIFQMQLFSCIYSIEYININICVQSSRISKQLHSHCDGLYFLMWRLDLFLVCSFMSVPLALL